MDSKLSNAVGAALERLAQEDTVQALLQGTARELVQLLAAERSAISRSVGDLLVEVAAHQPSGSTPQLDLYLASDYPLTQQVLERRQARIVSVSAPDADVAETELLGRLGFTELLMLPLGSQGRPWGLVEVYATRQPFREHDLKTAEALLVGAEKSLARLEHG